LAEHISEKLDALYFETYALIGNNVKEFFQKIAEMGFKYKQN